MRKKIAVLGAGESGMGAALLAKKKGLEVFVSDNGNINNKNKKVLSNHEIEWEEGKHSLSKILLADEVVKSPGIPDGIELIESIKSSGKGIISEVEFAYHGKDWCAKVK